MASQPSTCSEHAHPQMHEIEASHINSDDMEFIQESLQYNLVSDMDLVELAFDGI